MQEPAPAQPHTAAGHKADRPEARRPNANSLFPCPGYLIGAGLSSRTQGEYLSNTYQFSP
jgi:hypothetical protein